MEEPIDNEEYLNQLHIENEIKKMKLSLEHEAEFFSPSNKKLSPEQESKWLDQVQQFEDAYKNSKRVLIYDFIGKPVYKPVNEIHQAEIKSELKIIIDLLGEKGIGIDTICKVDERELYRFITEELFKEEINNMVIEGMSYNFIYEEFHPNHEHDIKTHCREFVEGLMNKMINLKFLPIAYEFHAKDGIIKQENVIQRIEIFREAFSSFKLHHFTITLLKINKYNADVDFEMRYSAIIEGSNEKQFFSGNGNFILKYEHDYWSICKINIPGISL